MRLPFAEGLQFGGEIGIFVRQHGDGEESGVQSACIADRKGGDGDAAGHLYDGIEAVHAAEGAALHRNAEDGEGRHAGGHAGQMRSTASTGDDAFQTTLGGGGGIIVKKLRRAVRADDFLFKGHAEVLQDLGGVLHGGPVGTGAHDDAHEGFDSGVLAHREGGQDGGRRGSVKSSIWREQKAVPCGWRMTFLDKLNQRIAQTGSNLCVGLDVRAENAEESTKRWILDVIAQTAPFAAAFKPNSAYFEALGWRGVKMLEEILQEIPKDIPVVLDVKRGDIGETQGYYAKACFDVMNVDAVTLNAYMGRDTLEPFLKYTDKGLYLLGVTSNPGAKDIELQKTGDRQVYELVAEMTKGHPQAGLVVGLTNAALDVLDHIPDVPLLIPGLGAQGGDLAALKGSGRKAPLLVNVSRGVLYQKDELSFAQRAEHWMGQIQQALG